MNALAIAAEATEDERTRRALLNILEDLQQEKDAFKLAHRRWMDTVDALDSPLLVHDASFCVLRANRAYAERAGMDFASMIGRPYWECFPVRSGPLQGCAEEVGATTGPVIPSWPVEFEAATGEVFRVRTFELGEGGGKGAWLHLFHDVTAERRTERQARAIEDLSVSDSMLTGDVAALAVHVTEVATQVCGVRRANVWLFNDAEDELRCIDSYELPSGRHSSGMVLRQAQFANEFAALKRAPYVDASNPLTDPRTSGYVEGYVKPLGITSMLDTVVQVSGRHIGLLCLEHVGQAHEWRPDEIAFASRLADKLAVAATNHRRQEMQHHLYAANEKLLAALGQTIETVALAVEKRDPYTAGHQRRVADLAVAIAVEIGMPADQVEGVRLGAIIHDIGKIYVPAEILARPGKLLPAEFELIKIHPQVGYDIVKGVEFPWPVAQMILQHHERLDGTGYPAGLKGEEIILEARVLSVADCVEAMASHRPYRAGLGIEAALMEIVAKRGVWLDPIVVDACVRLFREKGYVLTV